MTRESCGWGNLTFIYFAASHLLSLCFCVHRKVISTVRCNIWAGMNPRNQTYEDYGAVTDNMTGPSLNVFIVVHIMVKLQAS